MNECPECGGLLIEDLDEDNYSARLDPIGYYCPGCGWSSEHIGDAEELDDEEICPGCGITFGYHQSGCAEDDSTWY